MKEAMKEIYQVLLTEPHAPTVCAKLERIAREALAQPEQEPVAYFNPQKGGFYWAKPTTICAPHTVNVVSMPLYTAPPQRKPLTDEMRKQMKERCDSMEMRGAFADGWLSAEAAHGIKENT